METTATAPRQTGTSGRANGVWVSDVFAWPGSTAARKSELAWRTGLLGPFAESAATVGPGGDTR